MAHGPHRLSDIASQAGLSLATVDRVVHQRPGASARAVRAVEQAIAELDREQLQQRLGARSLLLDVVIQGPQRFGTPIQSAVEIELARLRPLSVRARFHLGERGSPADLAGHLMRLGTRGMCDGLILRAPDDPVVAAAVDRLADRGIPTVTLGSDLPSSRRVAYIGVDEESAGASAAYLIDLATDDRPGAVLVTVRRRCGAGEIDRLHGFKERCRREVVLAGDLEGLDRSTARAVRKALTTRQDIIAVYSIAGGNRGILAALDAAGVIPLAFVAHDLEGDNVGLLRSGRLTAVLHHDLRRDARRAVEQILRARRLVPGTPTTIVGTVEIFSPHNIPPGLA
jgi:LacI family transcriptional regulator